MNSLWLPVANPDFFAQVGPWFMALPHCKKLGLELVAAEKGKVTIKLPFKPELIGNPETRVLHGGVVTSLIDTSSGVALYTLLHVPEAAATLDLRIDYLRPAKPDLPLYCTAECYRLTDSIAFTRATAYQDDPAKPVAHSVATFARTSPTDKSEA
ncbi:PaaI family thioesterase [Chitinibacter sp. GC72]|uniref:PaaI family thioesterase n=1 Tax=Chitinibacter sp. GC72 TaxID=1526917 RepID=UPI0012FAB138|nr:PaaI family thioesterase [Chitinibacter sp. GC72]